MNQKKIIQYSSLYIPALTKNLTKQKKLCEHLSLLTNSIKTKNNPHP